MTLLSVLCFFLLYLIQLLSFYKSYTLDDDTNNDESDSSSAGTWYFPFRFDESVDHVGDSVGRVDDSVGHVHGVGSEVFVLTGIMSIRETVILVMFVPK